MVGMRSRESGAAALDSWETDSKAEQRSTVGSGLRDHDPITVAYLCPASDLYGTEVSVLATIRELDHKRFRPLLILPSDGLLVQEATASNIPVEVLPWLSAMFRKSPIHSFWTAVRLARWLRRRKVSILELTLWWPSLDLGIPVLAARLAGARFLFMNRLVLPSWLSLYEKLCLSSADGIVAVTRASIQPALRPRRSDRLFRIRPERIVVIPSARKIAMLQKRQALFLEAAAIVVDRVPEARFVIVGSPYTNSPRGPEYHRSLDRLVRTLGLESRVTFTGFRQDAIALMKLFRVLVLPSESEAEGSVLIEAMAVGVPIVASAVEGIPEIIEHGKTGLLIEGADAEEYANAIVRLLKDQAYARALGRAGRERAGRYDSTHILPEIENCYENLLSRATA
jgi:glycosyltransferase involved in cell wall biosynthesis